MEAVVRWLFRYCVIGMLLLVSTGVSARVIDPVRLFEKGSYLFNSHMEVLKDETNSLTIDDILSSEYQSEFYQSSSSILNLGISPHTYWLKVVLFYPDQYPNNSSVKEWYLEVGRSLLSVAELYRLQDDGSYLIKSSDMRLDFGSREISHVNSVFPIETVLGEKEVIYLKIQNATSALHFSLILWEPEAFTEKIAKEEFIYGLFFGSMIILLAYNLFLYASVKDDCYLYYVIYLGGVTVFEMIEIGHGAIHFDKIFEATGKEYVSAIIWVAFWGGTKFFTVFLDISNRHPRLKIIFDVSLWLIAIFFVMSLFKKDDVTVIWVTLFAIFFFGLLLVTTVYCWWKGNESARFFFFAWSFNAVGFVTYASMVNEVLPATWVTLASAPVGVILEALIFSFALAERIKIEGKKKLDADEMIVENMSKYRSVFENALEGMYWMSMEGIITNANTSMARIMGFVDERDVICNSDIVAETLYSHVDGLKAYIFDDVKNKELSFSRVSGESVWTHHSSRVIYDVDGVALHVEGTLVDVTEIKEKEKAIRGQIKERLRKNFAVSATKEKSQFLSMMNGKIRMPLTSIIGFGELLKDEGDYLDENNFSRKNLYVEIISENSRDLLNLINNILDFSKLEAGKFDVEKIRFSIVDLISSVDHVFSKKIKDKGIEFHIEFSTSIPEFALGDPTKILQIISNLCDNAIKHSGSGLIKIGVSWKDDFLNFKVSDQGAGIDCSEIKNVFSVGLPGIEQEGVQSIRMDSSDLGLPISKRFAILMGGDIGVSSEAGKGSIFDFSVKLELSQNTVWVESFEVVSEENNNVAVSHVSQSIKSPSSKEKVNLKLSGTVLLAEDNVVNQALLSRMLKKVGVSVVLANDGVEACDRCSDSFPDLILMDINMPNRNGIEAVSIIRETNVDVPIYVLTAETDQIVITEAMEAGCQGFLSKPIKKIKLYDVLEKYLTPPRGFLAPAETVEEPSFSGDEKDTIAEVAMKVQSSRVLLFSKTKPKGVLDKDILKFSDALPQINEFVRGLYENKRWEKLEEVIVQINGVAGDCKLDDLSRNSRNLISALQEEDMDEVNKWIYWMDKAIRQTEKDEKLSGKKSSNR